MPSLSLLALRDFLTAFYPALLSTGLLEGLQAYHSPDPDVRSTLSHWYQLLAEGQDWESAVRGLSPAPPGVITELLVLGAAQARLDEVVAEMNRLYGQHADETALYVALSEQLAQAEAGPRPDLICQGCLVQTLEKILARAALEQAARVLLSQTADAYFEQRYLGVKLILIREPSHALTYRTLYQTLDRASQSGGLGGRPEWAQAYTVHGLAPNTYHLQSPQQHLECVFITPLENLP
jgi:hypothetical protein